MINKFKLLKENFLLIVILIIGAALRFIGIFPGYPSHPDEAAYGSALVMLFTGNFDPGRYDYPSTVAIIHNLFFRFFFIPLGWINFYKENLGPILDGIIRLPLSKVDYDRVFTLSIMGLQQINTMYWGRYITAAFGVGVILFSYLLARIILGKKVALIAAFLIAVNFRQVLNSHLGLQDIYNAFFLSAMLYFIYRLIKVPSRKNYLLAGMINGIFFCVKFQTFGFPALLVAHLLVISKENTNLKNKIIKLILSPKLFLSIFTTAFVTILLNPYILINFELFRSVQTYQLSKYGIGVNKFDIYPYSYLFHYGIGEIISILGSLGILYSLIKYFKKSLIINLVIFQSMLTFTYLSHGGFYTRNFVTVTPLILILAALLIRDLFDFTIGRFNKKWIYTILIVIFVSLISASNIKDSYLIASEYSKPWNQNVLSDWEIKNLPKDAKVAAHPNTPLSVGTDTRLVYEPDIAFSIDEFAKNGADFAISNSAWSTNSFYWWMGGDPDVFIKHYWNKPVGIMEYMYEAIALRELGQFAIYEVTNPWQAPDIDFLVAKIPKYTILDKKEMLNFNFNDGPEGWMKQGKYWVKEDNLEWIPGSLVVKEEPTSIPSLRWESQVIDVSNWKGFEITAQMKSENSRKDINTGYIFTSFYSTKDDAVNSKNRIGVRLSARDSVDGNWIQTNLTGQIPQGAEFMTIGFYNYVPTLSEVEMKNVIVYQANVSVDFAGFKVMPIKVDQNNIFPNSHGNL